MSIDQDAEVITGDTEEQVLACGFYVVFQERFLEIGEGLGGKAQSLQGACVRNRE